MVQAHLCPHLAGDLGLPSSASRREVFPRNAQADGPAWCMHSLPVGDCAALGTCCGLAQADTPAWRLHVCADHRRLQPQDPARPP